MDQNTNTVQPLQVESCVSLCVDLDESLCKTDTLWEGLWFAARQHPWAFLRICLSVGGNRAAFKRRVAAIAPVFPEQLPFQQDLLALLSAEAGRGRQIILATAADELIARSVARHLGLFEYVIASDGVVNCKGSAKLQAIQAIYGSAAKFLYVGDSPADLPIWKASAGAIVVGNNGTVLTGLKQNDVPIYRHFASGSSLPRTIRRAIRVHQWPKNLLVFLPILLGHRATDIGTWKSGALVFIVFCVAASVAYVLNDLMDLEADRQHSKKRTRPFASGDLSIPSGLMLLAALGLLCVGLSAFILPAAQLWVAIYFVVTLFYSFCLKTTLIADVVGLAILYVLRVMAGGAATAIVISPWTLAFCLFFFFSLALVKRFGELRALFEHQTAPPRRAYEKADLSIVAPIGVSSGILSVVVFSLYISSPEVRVNYVSPDWLWLACPLILYWIGRLWILTNRGVIDEDPLLFSLKDNTSYITGALLIVIWIGASFHF